MKAWITQQPALSFYLLTLALSWGYWLTLLALGIRVGPGSVAHFPGLLGPMVAAILITVVIGSQEGLRELMGRMFYLGPRWLFRLLLGLSPLALGVVAAAVLQIMGRSPGSLNALTHIPGLPENWPFAAV